MDQKDNRVIRQSSEDESKGQIEAVLGYCSRAKPCWSGEGDEGPSSPGHGAIVVEETTAWSIMCDCREINHDPCALFHAARTSMAVQIGGNITGRHRIDFNMGVGREPPQGIGV